MVRKDDEWFISIEIDAELSHCILHGKEFLVLYWIIELGWYQLTQLVTDDAHGAVCVILRQPTAFGSTIIHACITQIKNWLFEQVPKHHYISTRTCLRKGKTPEHLSKSVIQDRLWIRPRRAQSRLSRNWWRIYIKLRYRCRLTICGAFVSDLALFGADRTLQFCGKITCPLARARYFKLII